MKSYSIDRIISNSKIGHKLFNKYSSKSLRDELRWSLKPIFINHLFDLGYDKVIYTDPDTYYFSDYTFLFDELEKNNILLTPHWRGQNPKGNEGNFNLQFVGGLFNAGFIGVNKRAMEAMDWWAEMCLYKCEKNFQIGHFVDQTYLNLMPVYFDKVKILKHQGCNVANWNQKFCKRTNNNGRILINDSWDIVFIHFTASTITGILYKSDTTLKQYLDEYISILRKYGAELDPERYRPKHSVDKKSRTTPQVRYRQVKDLLKKKIKRI